MKESQLPGCFLSITNPIVSEFHNSSLLEFPGLPWSLHSRKTPFISKAPWPILKYFAITDGQESRSCNLLLDTTSTLLLWSLYIAASAIFWVLPWWPNVLCAHLELEQIPTAVPMNLPWLQQGLTLTSLGESKMGHTYGAAVGWGSNPPSSVWVYCVPGQEGLHGMQA